jgi:hypothetical protein
MNDGHLKCSFINADYSVVPEKLIDFHWTFITESSGYIDGNTRCHTQITLNTGAPPCTPEVSFN